MKPRFIPLTVTLVLASAAPALAQCPTAIPQQVLGTITTPEIRAAAETFRLDAEMIAQNGGLQNMIALATAQLEADRGVEREEQGNQQYLAANGMGSSSRAADGRKVIQMSRDSQRLTAASIELMRCHARSGGASEPFRGADAASAQKAWALEPSERKAMLAEHSGQLRGGQAAPDLKQALESLNTTLHKRAMANASPEMAAFLAKQEATRLNNEANLAAAQSGRMQGLESAQREAVEQQVHMVTDVVTRWQAPRGYTRRTSVTESIIGDPFAPVATEPVREPGRAPILTGTGMEWDALRQVARVADPQQVCAGRLRVGDYPVLDDGSVLDSAARVSEFLERCRAGSGPVVVLIANGEAEVRQ